MEINLIKANDKNLISTAFVLSFYIFLAYSGYEKNGGPFFIFECEKNVYQVMSKISFYFITIIFFRREVGDICYVFFKE